MLISRLKELLSIPADKPELVMAQMQAFSRQVPLLYSILLANMVFVSYTHFDVSHWAYTIVFPATFGLFAAVRIIGWWRARHVHYTSEQAIKRLRATVKLCVVFGSVLTLWSFALLGKGDAFQKAHVAFFMAATMITCVFCLMHLRTAALVLTTLVTVPLCIVFSLQDNTVLLAIAANMALLTTGMMYVLSNHYEDFATMVEQKASLLRINEETRRLSDENHRLANLDALTSLPNRRSFISEIEALVATKGGSHSSFAVGLIDLDGFKAVNDLYGHAAGDALLIEASQRLQALSDKRLTFSRLGGDEFGFVVRDTAGVATIGSQICAALGQSYMSDGITLQVSASCGIALYPDSCSTTSELLEYADYALYQAKEHQSGDAVIFTASHRDQLHVTHQVDQTLRNADLAQEMQLHYQPVVDRESAQVVAVEALARWRSPSLGSVAPMQFIATAERSVLIHKITLALLTRLLTDMKSMPKATLVSFNLSAKSLACPQTMLKILAMVQASGVDPRRLVFEITETALVANFEVAMSALNLLRNMGALIALDDFGTGFSSLSYVHQLPLDKIKIDRRFVTDVCHDVRAQKVVRTIVGLSRDLGVKCVAEGVETAEQADVLTSLGCTLMQGYHFAIPMPPGEVIGYLARHGQPNDQLAAQDRAAS